MDEQKIVIPGKVILGPSGQVLRAVEGGAKPEEQIAAEQRVRQAQQKKAIEDTTRMQLMVGRIEKSIGKNVDQRILLASLSVIAARAMLFSPVEVHGNLVANFMNGVKAFLWANYPADVKQKIMEQATKNAEETLKAAAKVVEDAVVDQVNKEKQGDAPAENEVREGAA
jgi:hypothetical protein